MPVFSLSSILFVYDQEVKPTKDQAAAVAAVAALGFREVELAGEDQYGQVQDQATVRALRRALEQTSIRPHTLHTPLNGTNLASDNEGIRQESVGRIAASIRILGELGGRTAIVHPTGRPGAGETPYTLKSLGQATERVYRSLTELVPVAQQSGVRIALENLPNVGYECRPLENMRELRAFITGFPAEYVGLCLDTGHARISGFDPAAQARIASDRLYALHLQDVDGVHDNHWVPGRGVIDWPTVGAALQDIVFDGAWTIEILVHGEQPTLDEIAANCQALHRRWLEQGIS